LKHNEYIRDEYTWSTKPPDSSTAPIFRTSRLHLIDEQSVQNIGAKSETDFFRMLICPKIFNLYIFSIIIFHNSQYVSNFSIIQCTNEHGREKYGPKWTDVDEMELNAVGNDIYCWSMSYNILLFLAFRVAASRGVRKQEALWFCGFVLIEARHWFALCSYSIRATPISADSGSNEV